MIKPHKDTLKELFEKYSLYEILSELQPCCTEEDEKTAIDTALWEMDQLAWCRHKERCKNEQKT